MASSQEAPCRIKVTVPDAQPGDSLIFTEFYADKQLSLDTVVYKGEGEVLFACPAQDKPGRYAVVLPRDKNVDFLFSGSSVEMTIRSGDLPFSVSIEKGLDSQLMYEYIMFMDGVLQRRRSFDEILYAEHTSAEEKNDAEEAVAILAQEVLEKQLSMERNHPESLMALYLGMVQEVEPVDAPAGVVDPERWALEDFRRRYWGRADLSDPAVLRDPIISMMMDYYFRSILPPNPEVVFSEAMSLMSLVDVQSPVWKYFVEYFIFNYVDASVVCMDKVFVRVFEHLDGQNELGWIPERDREELRQLASAMGRSVCGETMPDLTLLSRDGEWKSLYDMQSKYRLVVVWDSECEHCLEQFSVLESMSELLESKGVSVMAIGHDFHPEGWEVVLANRNWGFAEHVTDLPWMQNSNAMDSLIQSGITNSESLGFREYLDIRTTPKLYLVDENHQILAKGMLAESVPALIQSIEE